MIKQGEISHLSGASQDEISLLTAASESQFAEFLNKDSESIIIKVNSKVEKY